MFPLNVESRPSRLYYPAHKHPVHINLLNISLKKETKGTNSYSIKKNLWFNCIFCLLRCKKITDDRIQVNSRKMGLIRSVYRARKCRYQNVRDISLTTAIDIAYYADTSCTCHVRRIDAFTRGLMGPVRKHVLARAIHAVRARVCASVSNAYTCVYTYIYICIYIYIYIYVSCITWSM